MEDTLNDSLQKVPLLGDIPILGKLFQFKSKQRVKTNLLFSETNSVKNIFRIKYVFY